MSLLLPTPTNLMLPAGTKSFIVSQDMYNICQRIKEEIEGGERLYVVLHEEPSGAQYYTIMEHCVDGKDRVAIPRREELDARVLERLRYILQVPLDRRLDEIERLEKKHEKDEHEAELDELYERMGRPMWTQLEKDGFIAPRSRSYAKVGVTSHGRRAR